MIVDTVRAQDVFHSGRLDPEFHLSEGVKARRRISQAQHNGLRTLRLGGPNGLAVVSQPGRFKRIYAQTLEESVPYLRPYDVFDYTPILADRISVRGTRHLDELRVSPGTIVVPASGRNLGPAVAVDECLAHFVLSHDAIRVQPRDLDDAAYILAFINCPTGQAIIRSGITGSVIDHISVSDLTDLQVPMVPEHQRIAITTLMRASIELRDRSRTVLAQLVRQLSTSLGSVEDATLANGWTLDAQQLTDRLDAAAYSPTAAHLAERLRARGGRRLGDVAEVMKPASRYKAYHVTARHGVPFLTGSQLRQAKIIAPKYMADRVFQEPDRYVLSEGDVVFAADGRANEGLGVPVMVTSDRTGWLASEHIMRIRAREGTNSGALFLALSVDHVQRQIQALPRGSVVDTLYVGDANDIVIPPVETEAGEAAAASWESFSCADALEQRAMFLIEAALNSDDANIADVLLTVRETAAVLSSEESEVYALLRRGVLTSVGQLSMEDILILLSDVMRAAAQTTDEPSDSEYEWTTAYGHVREVSADTFLADLSSELSGAGEVVEFPRDILQEEDRERLSVGDHFVFKSRVGLMSSADSVVARLLPRPILTEEQVNDAYRWADSFLKDYFIGGIILDRD